MKRRLFLYTLIGAMPLWKWFSAIASEVKNAPKNPPQFTDITAFGDERPFRCLVIGDWGSGSQLQKTVALGMNGFAEKNSIDCILSTGDNIYGSGVESVSDKQWKTKFENIYTGEHLQKPWYPILGNHDYRGNVQAQIDYGKVNPRWKLEHNFYKLSIAAGKGSLEIFALDSNLLVNGNAKDMLAWLEKELSKSTANWKIVMSHHMLRSYGVYGDQKFMLNALKPMCDKYGVDICMCGHDHDIQLIKHPNDRFYQLVCGAGGGSRDTSWGEHSLFAATNGGFAALSITSRLLKIQILDKLGGLIFSHTIAKS